MVMVDFQYGLLHLTPLDAGLLAQRHQIEIHPPPFSTPSEKIEG